MQNDDKGHIERKKVREGDKENGERCDSKLDDQRGVFTEQGVKKVSGDTYTYPVKEFAQMQST